MAQSDFFYPTLTRHQFTHIRIGCGLSLAQFGRMTEFSRNRTAYFERGYGKLGNIMPVPLVKALYECIGADQFNSAVQQWNLNNPNEQIITYEMQKQIDKKAGGKDGK